MGYIEKEMQLLPTEKQVAALELINHMKEDKKFYNSANRKYSKGPLGFDAAIADYVVRKNESVKYF